MSFMDFQLAEYRRLLTLASSLNQPQLGEAVSDAKSRAQTMKRRYEEIFTLSLHQMKKNTNVPPPPTTTTDDRDNSKHEEAMKFVAEFKRMNWVACLKEGKDANILNYKNSQQFVMYMKGKSD